MNSWVENVFIIHTAVTGRETSNWRTAFREIGYETSGVYTDNWRLAIRNWARMFSENYIDWQMNIRRIAVDMGCPIAFEELTWLEALEWIAEHYAPSVTLFFLNTLPRQLNTKYLVLSDGIIESDKVVMA